VRDRKEQSGRASNEGKEKRQLTWEKRKMLIRAAVLHRQPSSNELFELVKEKDGE
jgi:hypothetical protein